MKRVLVFGGGGSKGAYEIGVWKALDELGLQFDAVCGTSIGALIGTMYVQQDYDKLVELWEKIDVEDVIASGINLDFDMDLLMSQKGKYKELLAGYVQHKGADIRPFKEMLTKLFDADKFFSSDIDFACMCVNVTKRKAQRVFKKDMDADNGVDWLLASSACFPAFPMHTIKEEKYIDGGYSSNVPISLAKAMHADMIVAADLKYETKKRHKSTKYLMYIQPHVPLGSFLYFDQTRILRNRTLGYLDTMKAFQRYEGTIYTFYHEEKLLYYEEAIKGSCKEIADYMKGLWKQVEHERYPYLAILEMIAYDFQLEDSCIYHIQELVEHCLDVVDNSMYHGKKIDKERLKEMIKMRTISTKKESILVMLAYLKDNHEQPKLSRLMKETYIKAFLLYQLQKKVMPN